MNRHDDASERIQPGKALLLIAVLGSLWGLSEVFVSGAIRMSTLPFRAGILTGIGLGLIAIAVGALRRPGLLLGIPVLAALCKLLVVPILKVSPVCEANSCMAVLLEGSAMAGAVVLAGQRLHRSRLLQAASAASAALLAAGVFFYAGMHVAPCNYLMSFNRPFGLMAFMGSEGLSWALASALLFPLGYRLGEGLRAAVLIREEKPGLFYLTSSALVLGSWIISAIAIAKGF